MEQKQEQKEFRHIVRVANTDLDGKKYILHSLRKIKGINYMFANALCSVTGIEKTKKTGDLSEQEQKKLEEAVRNPVKFNLPSWMFNRRNDYDTGEDKHIIAEELMFVKDNDIKMMKKIRSYKGVRHSIDQPVRGQRTKSNFRKNKGKVSLGVKKKAGVKAGRV